ncbi:MAG: LptF/LptG family permease [Rickettsiales bacterium]|jgi:lipopolysaccharide export system permease protein|nr:LptF/LptG family permease [Rickettsiales bacterium]
MKVLDRYFFRQVWTAFVGFGLVLGGLAWMVQILLLMKMIIKYGVDIGGFVGMSLWTFPMLIGIIAPFVIFIAVMFTHSRMVETNEIAVCMASGLSPFSIARPAVMVGAMVTALHLAMNLFVVPKSQDIFYSEQWSLRYGLGNLKLRESSFNQLTAGVVIYVEQISQKDLAGITMIDRRSSDERIITAKNGKLVGTPKGMSIAMGSGGFQTAGKYGVTIGTFDGAEMDMDMGGADESKSLRPRRVSTGGLLGLMSELESHSARSRTKIVSEAANRFLSPLLDLLFVLIAVTALLKTNILRRRASFSSAIGSVAMAGAETAFISISSSVSTVGGLLYLGIGEVAIIAVLLWILRK